MTKTIPIFKSFEAQKQYNLEQLRKTTPLERFRSLYSLQKFSTLFNPVAVTSRKIVIQSGIKITNE